MPPAPAGPQLPRFRGSSSSNSKSKRAVVPVSVRHVAERIWRVRKHHTWIDAQLRPAPDGAGFELQFFYDGLRVLSRTYSSRRDAVAYADSRLHDLQRVGWNTHW